MTEEKKEEVKKPDYSRDVIASAIFANHCGRLDIRKSMDFENNKGCRLVFIVGDNDPLPIIANDGDLKQIISALQFALDCF